jgi:cell division protein FtsB
MKKEKGFKIKEKLSSYTNYLVILFAIFLIISLVRNWARIEKTDTKILEKQQKVEELEKENEEVGRKLEEINSEQFIEKQLRDNLGMAKEGEIVVVLPDEEILRKMAPKADEEEEVLPDPNWVRWMKLFI